MRRNMTGKKAHPVFRKTAAWLLAIIFLMGAVPALAAAAPDYPIVNISAQKTVEAADGSEYDLPAGAFDFILTPAPINPAADPVKEPLKLTNRADGVIPVLVNATYTQPGTYYYVLEENFRPVPGMQYTDRGYLITVVISQVSGRLQANVSMVNEDNEPVGADELRFLNIYDPEDITVVVEGTKVLEGGELAGGEFAFRISPVSAAVEAEPEPTEEPTATPDPAPTPDVAVPTAEPEPDETPSVSATVTPEATAENPSGPAAEETASPTPDDTGEPDEEEESSSSAENTPEPTATETDAAQTDMQDVLQAVSAPTPEPMPAAVPETPQTAAPVQTDPDSTSSGEPGNAPEDEEIEKETAELPADEMPMPLVDTVSNTVAGTFHFGNIHFTQPGTYIYSVSEVTGSDSGTLYDPTLYTVIITVERGEDGALTATQTVEGADAIVFRNTANNAQLIIEKDQIRNTTVPTRSLLTCAAGDIITYRLIVSNPSSVTALDAIVTDRIPSGLVLLPESVSNGGTLTSDRLSWRLGSIEPGGQRIVIFNVRVPSVTAHTRWENVASVSFENNTGNAADGTRQEIPSNIVTAEVYPQTGTGQTTTTPTGGTSPRTDDTTNLGLWTLLLFTSIGMGAFAVFILIRNRRRSLFMR